MIETKTNVKIDTGKLFLQVEKGNRAAMYKAGALMMRMARQKIRYRSYRTSSVPGAPPFKHTTGATSFSHSIRFAVDSAGTTVVVGPQRENKAMNPSGPVPRTLEFGGRTRKGSNSMWFQSRGVPPGITTKAQVAAFFRRQGWGPIRMSTSPGALKKRSGVLVRRAPDRSGKAGRYKLVYYIPARITSSRQAARAAENAVRYFGYPSIASSTIAPRPFMGPTLRENQGKILDFWEKIV